MQDCFAFGVGNVGHQIFVICRCRLRVKEVCDTRITCMQTSLEVATPCYQSWQSWRIQTKQGISFEAGDCNCCYWCTFYNNQWILTSVCLFLFLFFVHLYNVFESLFDWRHFECRSRSAILNLKNKHWNILNTMNMVYRDITTARLQSLHSGGVPKQSPGNSLTLGEHSPIVWMPMTRSVWYTVHPYPASPYLTHSYSQFVSKINH